MVAEMHPHDIELFEYVEDELPQARREEIAAHLATCGVCAAQVELAAAGREALRGTELLELPEDRREAILRNLPAPERVVGEGRAFSPKLVLAGLTALLLLAAVIGVLVNSNPNSGDESSAGAAAEAAGQTSGGGKTDSSQVRASLFAIGPAAAVADDLRKKGFKASLQKDRVVVRGATEEQVREALADRGPGDVEVVVKNP
jgi:anti-sigma factor RsiW